MASGWRLAFGLMALGGLSAGAAEQRAASPAARRFAASSTPVRGSEAEEALQGQVAARLFDLEKGARPTCTPKLLNAKVVEPEGNGAWVERWFVKGCLQILPYRVAFTPDRAGAGTVFTVAADAGSHGAPSR